MTAIELCSRSLPTGPWRPAANVNLTVPVHLGGSKFSKTDRNIVGFEVETLA
jgi:hypothetical protein